MRIKIFLIIICLLIIIMKGKVYFNIAEISFHPVFYVTGGSISAGDYDGDGMRDILLGGMTSSSLILQLFRQNSTFSFYSVTNRATFPGGIPPGFFAGRVRFD